MYAQLMSYPRLPRNTRIEPVSIRFLIERKNKERFAAIAAHSNYSASALFDVMVENIQLDDEGYPVWLPERPTHQNGELPIDSA